MFLKLTQLLNNQEKPEQTILVSASQVKTITPLNHQKLGECSIVRMTNSSGDIWIKESPGEIERMLDIKQLIISLHPLTDSQACHNCNGSGNTGEFGENICPSCDGYGDRDGYASRYYKALRSILYLGNNESTADTGSNMCEARSIAKAALGIH